MRLAVLSVLVAATAISPATAAGGADPGTVGDPTCRVTLTSAPESHGHRYSTRCNFEQISVRIALDSRLYDLDPEPRLSGAVDPGDGMRCRQLDPLTASCEGVAGSDVRVGGYLETKRFHCEVPIRFRIFGGPDCPPAMACPEIAYVVRERFEEPTDCAPGA